MSGFCRVNPSGLLLLLLPVYYPRNCCQTYLVYVYFCDHVPILFLLLLKRKWSRALNPVVVFCIFVGLPNWLNVSDRPFGTLASDNSAW